MAEETNAPDLTAKMDAFWDEVAKYTAEHLQEALETYRGPKWTDTLMKSILTELVKSGGSVQQMLTRFRQYGRFVDMGVGRGVPIGAAGTGAFSAARTDDGKLKRYRRRKKPWYSKTYFHEVQKIKELYAREFGNTIPVAIQEELSATIAMTV